MAKFEGKFESSFQDWETPDNLFSLVKIRYALDFDVAADAVNAKCDSFFTANDNALNREWSGSCWLNPPYGGRGTNKLEQWVKKAYKESLKVGCSVTMLIPARTNTNWWHDYCMKAEEILFIKGRPKFGGAKHGLPQPLTIVFFNGESCRRGCGTLDLKNNRITMPIPRQNPDD